MSRGDIKDHQIINASLDSVGAAAAYGTAEWKHFDPGATTNGNYDILLANGVGVAEVGLMKVKIPFGTAVDFTQGGHLDVSINPTQGFFSANVASSTSYVYCTTYESDSVEQGLPSIKVQTVDQNVTNDTFAPGSCVRQVIFVNRDKTSILSAAQVINNINTSSRFKNQSFQYIELLSDRASQFESGTEATARRQTFSVYHFNQGKLGFDVAFNANLNGTNVNSNKNYWVCWKLQNNANSRRVASSTVQRFQNAIQTA
jgi:hypothetical protein